MFNAVIPTHKQQLLNEIEGKALLIYKGFPPSFIKGVAEVMGTWNLIEPFYNDDLLIDPEKVQSGKAEMLSDLLKAEAEIIVLPYEICYPISQGIDLTLLNRKNILIDNTLFDQYPKTLPIEIKDIENEREVTVSEEYQKIFNTFYANSTIRYGLDFVEYADLPENVSAELIKSSFFKPIDFKSLDNIKYFNERDLENTNHIVFRSSDSSYDKFRYELFWDNFKSDVLLVVEDLPNDMPSNEKRELEAIINLFKASSFKLTIGIIEAEKKNEYREDFDSLLDSHWGSQSFRSINFYKNPNLGKETHDLSQGAIIEEIVRQSENALKDEVYKDIFLTAPTGSGKSVLFQIPALYLAEQYNSITIVVSPLKALMKDQIEGLRSRGIFNAAYINSDISLIERNNIIDGIKDGTISILYLSPELLLSYHIEHFIGERTIGLLVIDEAHLVTTWGRDFRVDYWFLGNYIKKLRKYYSSKFPVVAVTATAVYGGPDDLVFETVESLNMQMRQLFIGNIRRDDIEFQIDQVEYDSYEEERKQKTIDRIKYYIDNGIKAIIYFPWTSQIREIHLSLEEDYRNKVQQYYGSVDKELRAEVLEGFRDGELKVVLATKAFGMGVDVSDIEEVYHHAPSGNLADYIQEIGRVARQKDINGIAKVDFSKRDLKYTKVLYGLSAIRQWHVSNVLQKLNRVYKLKKSRNFLVSVEDFKHIFSDQLDDSAIEQKVKSSLLLLERDLLGKYRYNVIIVRPKALFSTVYLKVKSNRVANFIEQYGRYADEVEIDRTEKIVYVRGAEVKRKDKRRIFQFRLNDFWEDELSKESFPKIKRDFFEGELFEDFSESIFPQHRLRITLNAPPKEVQSNMLEYFKHLEQAFLDLGSGFFTKRELSKALSVKISSKSLRDRIADLLTAIFSTGRALKGRNRYKDDMCFLQKKRFGNELKYRIYNNQYYNIKERIERQFVKMFFRDSNLYYEDYITTDPIKSKIYHDIAYLIESFELGTFEFDGGQSPHLFIRINDPSKVDFLIRNNYSNDIIRDIQKRHESSMKIMEEFFMSDMESDNRWDFVEDYFLGYDLFKEGDLTDV